MGGHQSKFTDKTPKSRWKTASEIISGVQKADRERIKSTAGDPKNTKFAKIYPQLDTNSGSDLLTPDLAFSFWETFDKHQNQLKKLAQVYRKLI